MRVSCNSSAGFELRVTAAREKQNPTNWRNSSRRTTGYRTRSQPHPRPRLRCRFVFVPLVMGGPTVAGQTRRVVPLMLTVRAAPARFEGVPVAAAGANPARVPARFPPALGTADPAAGARCPSLRLVVRSLAGRGPASVACRPSIDANSGPRASLGEPALLDV
jgi:hypothetical protein